MNFLQLCQLTRQKCQTGTASTPTTVASQTGTLKLIVDWVNEAWEHIQRLRTDWKWMKGDVSFPTIASQQSYAASTGAGTAGVSDLAAWMPHSFRVYLTAIGRSDESFLGYVAYPDWRDIYDYGSNATLEQRPYVITFKPDNDSLYLSPIPDAVYTVTGRYRKKASQMSVDADEPGMPSDFHMAIVYKAMMLYGASEGAPEVYADGKAEFDKILAQMERTLTEPFSLGDSLA